MGERALVTFHSGESFSPATYLHWHAWDVPKILADARKRMRGGDESYSAARFVGACHELIEGNLSLGLHDAPRRAAHTWTEEQWDTWGQGDMGVFVVDCRTWQVTRHAGYSGPARNFTVGDTPAGYRE